MKYLSLAAFVLILAVYSFLFMATSMDKPPLCEGDCAKVEYLKSNLRSGRESYLFTVNRCFTNRVNDTLCVYVRDTAGIDWERFADTVCMTATAYGLERQKIYIIKPGLDTVVHRTCP